MFMWDRMRNQRMLLLLLLLPLLVFYLVFNCQSINVEGQSNVHIVYLGEREHDDPKLVTESHHDMLSSVLESSKEMAAERLVYSYRHGFSGFAAKLTKTQAQKLSELPGVVRVMRNSFYRLQTTRSWDFLGLGLSSAEPGPTDLLYKSNMGDGVVIGVFDTGIWPESKSFIDKGLGPIPSRWKGECEPGEQFNPDKHCNKKIIGARWFVKGFLAEYGKSLNESGNIEFLSPRDANGHGTHTASTAAGSIVNNVTYKGMARGTVRGGAPRARIAVYKICWNVFGGQCSSADILKAFDEAIHDGVDVLSLSIGGSIPLFSEVDDRDGIAVGSFHAAARGITVICGAANDGPAALTVQNTAPWILTIAASTMDRAFVAPVTLGNGETILGQAMYVGKEIGSAILVYPEGTTLDPTSSGICQNLLPNTTQFARKVVLCFTAANRRAAITIAAAAVKVSGGLGLIVAKNPTDGLAPCVDDDFPCIEVDYEAGTRILYYSRSTSSPIVTLKPTVTEIGERLSGGAKVAFFSSRGPSSITPEILKPDIAAPGVNILAATSPFDPLEDNGYAVHSGTSMSTPHVSGIVALLKALHPSWSPAAIKSAILTTARRCSPLGFPILSMSQKIADPFDYGGGIINPNEAAKVGLVYDMDTVDNYIDYLCRRGYNESAISRLVGRSMSCMDPPNPIYGINLPSITISSLKSTVTLTRVVTNVGNPWSTYWAEIESPIGTNVMVSPWVLRFNATAKKKMAFKVIVQPLCEVNAGYYFGSLTWTNGVNHIRIPLAVRMEYLPSRIIS